MNTLLRSSLILAVMLFMGMSSETYAQRCGGWVRYIVRDKGGAITDPESAGLKFVRVNGTDYLKDNIAGVESIKGVGFQTHCGKRLVEVMLQIESRVMLLRFHNLPPEIDFFVDSLPFQEGTFEIDFKREMRLTGQELNREGLRDKDGNLLLGGTARSGYLVAASSWKKSVNPQ